MTSTTIDIGIIVFLLVMIIIGYMRGFVLRLYSLVSLIVSILGAYIISDPVSKMIIIYKLDDFLSTVGEFINRMIIFFVLFVIIKLLLMALGFLLRPFIKDVLYKVNIIEKADHVLGVFVGLIEGFIYVYFILILVVSPLVGGGKDAVDNSFLGNQIVKLIPNVYSQLSATTDLSSISINTADTGDTLYSVATTLNKAYDAGLISNEQLNSMAGNYIQYLDDVDSINLTSSQREEVVKLVNKLDNTKYNHEDILKKIKVSETDE
ncbi:MAG: CvpA family protein [Thomasclavelia sp.]|jgi:uncharacterized membrane protein required for colicin V production|nr:CvpA family protein [Thomasclavelia sp.]